MANARSPYIARLDMDDLMMPERLQREFDYLEAHPDVAMVCTYAQLIFERTLSNKFYRAPLNSKALALRLVFECPIVHPCVMFRATVLRELGGYSEDNLFSGAEDFELWTRMAHQHKLKCLPEPLTRYRVRSNSVSHSRKTLDHNVVISANTLHWYLRENFSTTECRALAAIYHRNAESISPLPLKEALTMFNVVAGMIAVPRSTWDKETAQVFAMQRRLIFFHHLSRNALLRPLAQMIPGLRLR